MHSLLVNSHLKEIMVLAKKKIISNSKHQNKQKYILYLAILVSGYFNAGTKLVHLKREEEDRKGNLTSKFFLNKKCIISAFLHIVLLCHRFYHQVQLPTAGHSRLELPARPLPRGGQADPLQGLRHQVRHHRSGQGR